MELKKKKQRPRQGDYGDPCLVCQARSVSGGTVVDVGHGLDQLCFVNPEI